MSTGRLPSVDGGIQPTIVDAKGDLIVATAADTVSRLAVGSNDQVLTADSTTATGLKWATAASGGMTLISTTTLTGASVTLSSIPGTYNHLQLVFRSPRGVTDGSGIRIRVNGDSNANRHRSVSSLVLGGAVFDDTSWTSAVVGDNTVTNAFAIWHIWDYANTSTWKVGQANIWLVREDATSEANYSSYRYAYNQTSAITSLDIFPTTGNWSAGTVLLYGVK